MKLLPKDQIHYEDRVSLPMSSTVALVILLLILFILSLLGTGLIFVFNQMQGIDFQDILSGASELDALNQGNFMRITVMINQLFMFTLPALCFSWWMYREEIWSFLSLNKFPSIYWALWAIIWIIAALPLVQFTFWLNQQLPLPAWAIDMEDSTNSLISGLLQTETTLQLLFNLFIMAVLPGVGEELIFRGILQQHLAKVSNSMTAGIWISSILFSAMHLQFEGFLPRLFLGLMLAYLFYWTANLWLPILAHLFYNGSQVLAYFFVKDAEEVMRLDEAQTVSWPLTLFSLIFVLALAYHFRKSGRSTVKLGNRSPAED